MGGATDSKKRPYGKAAFWGVLSIGAYALVFANADTVTHYFTQGKWYAALPIITVFIFSYLHGSFANYALSAVGLEAKKKR